MLLIVQLPFVDFRYFGDSRTGWLLKPQWPFPAAGQFVRSFGAIVQRATKRRASWHGGIRRDMSESHYLDCTRKLLVPRVEIETQSSKLLARHVFTRFHSDGLFCSRFEFGFLVRGLELSKELPLAIDALVSSLRAQPVMLKRPVTDPWLADPAASSPKLTLHNFVPRILRNYVAATTSHEWKRKAAANINLTQPLKPTVLLVANPTTQIKWLARNRLRYSQDALYDAATVDIAAQSAQIKCWLIGNYRSRDAAEVRWARLALLRLAAEKQATLRCLMARRKGDVLEKLSDTDRELFETAILRSLNRLGDTGERLTGETISKEEDAPQELHILGDASLYRMINEIAETTPFDYKRALLSKAKQLDNVHIALGDQVMGDKVEGDKPTGDQYYVGQAAHAGPTYAETVNYNTIWAEQKEKFDFDALHAELGKLRQAAMAQAGTADETIAAGAIAQAEQAAQAKDGPGMMAALAKAGKWALGIAEKIGIGVAVAALKAVIVA